jgi:hypothetical protein
MIDARAVAVQGIGFSPRLVAVQGFGPIEVTPLPPVSGVVRGGGFRRQRDLYDWSSKTYNLTRLHQQDQEVAELLVALVTKGFFDGDC